MSFAYAYAGLEHLQCVIAAYDPMASRLHRKHVAMPVTPVLQILCTPNFLAGKGLFDFYQAFSFKLDNKMAKPIILGTDGFAVLRQSDEGASIGQ